MQKNQDRSDCGCAPSCCSDEVATTQTQTMPEQEKIREHVRQSYGEIATGIKASCGCSTSCCGGEVDYGEMAGKLGYTPDQINSISEGANLGLGCGNPQAIAKIKPGETVLDLGSGAGFDAFLAAKQVGNSGSVYGVDMTPEMVTRARQNAKKNSIENVSFYLGEIESLPIKSNFIDVVISNCVINLSPEKKRVFSETFRVLKPGGRLAISDIITLGNLPPSMQSNLDAISGCIGGASTFDEIETILRGTGFEKINITTKPQTISSAESQLNEYIASAAIEAVKPK